MRYAGGGWGVRYLAIAGALLLSACTSLLTPPYSRIDVQEYGDGIALKTDTATCQGYAVNHRSPFSLGTIANKTAQGGLSNLGSAPISVLIPVAGAAGGAGAEILRESGLTTDAQWAVFVKCLTLKGERSRAYLVIEPN